MVDAAIAAFAEGVNFDLEYRIRDIFRQLALFPRTVLSEDRQSMEKTIMTGIATDITKCKRSRRSASGESSKINGIPPNSDRSPGTHPHDGGIPRSAVQLHLGQSRLC